MTETPDVLLKKVQGCLYGGAIGDAMGGVAEWRTPDEIRERYGYITDLVVAWDAPNDASLSVAKDGAARCVALGFLVVTGGDYDGTVMAGTNYGRDNDSIAGMGAAIAGDLADLTRKLQREQQAAAQARRDAFAALGG